VDQIIEDAPLTISKEFIIDNNIDVVVHGNDKNPQFEIQHKVPLDMGIMRYVEYTKGISTSEIIDRIKKL
jgi:glycerol-3-phosphate cytidylyltransferase-like family protein